LMTRVNISNESNPQHQNSHNLIIGCIITAGTSRTLANHCVRIISCRNTSSYSCKMNQMVAHEIQDLYWFRRMGSPSPIGGDAALLVFVCLVTGADAPPSYSLE
jgi:hypothetical protein